MVKAIVQFKNNAIIFIKKNYLLLILIILLIISIIKKQKPIIINNVDNTELIKLHERSLFVQDSLYIELKKEILSQILDINNKIKVQEEQSTKKIKTIKKKYEEEYNKVSNTNIDNTIINSTKYLSEDINFRK